MKKILAILLVLASTHASAAEDGFNLLWSLGLTTGGETLAELNTGGKLKSGGLIYFALGTVYQFSDSPYQLQASVGYHFDSLEADNGNASFDRTFFEIIPFYKINESTRAGLGVTSILSADYSEPGIDVVFDNPVGLIAEVDWKLTDRSWWGLRYVNMEYAFESVNSVNVSAANLTIDGSYFGVMINGGF